ncbi:DUF747-domain-containing protein [Auriscalpium vulgare]|uniref:DUF747-domain-containing protein n=1 Tax=Auriscalpium vulgare TaxID=40419 RepID=A0ACB8RQA9_9AGAM|nr:DUF747-domain-containing protein [Auriscalpium vulgare]
MDPRSRSPHRPGPGKHSFSASSSSPSIRRNSNAKFAHPVRRPRPRTRHRSSSQSADRDLAFSSTHDASDDALELDHDEESDRDVTPLRTVSRRRRVSDPHPSLSSARAFRPPSPEDDRPPLTYASLPPTPITSSPPPSDLQPSGYLASHESADFHAPPFSLWDYLQEELLATDFDSHQELKWERVSNFLAMPLAIEKIISFGFVLCFDSFLYTFTIQPIRFALAVWRLLTGMLLRSKISIPPSQKADILRTALLVVSVLLLIPLTDASKIYHSIRGQDTIKLYVIFNALEIADRLCASFGQDIIDCLFSRSTLLLLSRRLPVSTHTIRPILYLCLATLYTVLHALVMVYQMICLNVAINSYDNALLSLLMSNQFVEIKGSVFKKFEKDNLFQITCADIVERFTLGIMLFFVAFRNLIELSGSEFDFSEGVFLPKSFGWFRGGIGGNVLWTISYPVLTVMISEALVDWLKHAFITKFNHIRPSVYERYTDVLCRDLASGSAVGRRGARKHSYVDQSPLVARRLGFAALPLAVLTTLIGSQALGLLLASALPPPPVRGVPAKWWAWAEPGGWEEGLRAGVDWTALARWTKWGALGLMFWMCLVLIKIIMGVALLGYATRRQSEMEAREAADVVNDFGRDPIGEGLEERQKYNRELKTLLDNVRDNATRPAEVGERKAGETNEGGGVGGDGKKKRPRLEELTRFTMVKRIW